MRRSPVIVLQATNTAARVHRRGVQSVLRAPTVLVAAAPIYAFLQPAAPDVYLSHVEAGYHPPPHEHRDPVELSTDAGLALVVVAIMIRGRIRTGFIRLESAWPARDA
jgi:hypothetical protein